MKTNKKGFSFLKVEGSILDKILHRINTVMMGILDAKPYILDWDHVLSHYDKLGASDVEEFASGYAFGWHAMNGKLNDQASKEAMYLEILDGIMQRRDGSQ